MKILSFIFGKSEKQSAIGKQIKMRAEEFVVNYGEQYKGLDFSQQSLVVIDRLLGEFSEDWKIMSAEVQNELLTNTSSYILWVAQQQYNGIFYWSEQHAQPVLVIGEPDYRIAFFVQSAIRKRIEGGIDENISIFYRKISDKLQHIVQNENVLIA